MIKFKLMDKIPAMTVQRRKFIIIEDSFMKVIGSFDKKSFILSARNPMRKDETIIDYDMDSEDEWNE
jgi:hypothetical protein